MCAEFLKEEVSDTDAEQVVRMLVVESERKYQSLVEHALVGIYILDAETVLFSNPYLQRLVGYTPEEMEGIRLDKVIAPESLSNALTRVERRLKGESVVEEYELKLVHSTGHTIDVRARGVRCKYQGKPAVLGTLIDISQAVYIQSEMSRMRDIVDNCETPIISIDAYGIIRFINKSVAETFAKSSEELIEMPFAELIDDSAANEKVERLLSECQENGRFLIDLQLRVQKEFDCRFRVKSIAMRDHADQFAGAALYLQ